MTIYDFTVKNTKGDPISLSDFQGKVLLVVNTATRCGLTPQYEALEKLYQTYQKQGFEILDFPSNQFLKQAPGSDEEINDFCVLNYNTTFPRFAKIAVNGKDTDPLYAWLKSEKPIDSENNASKSFERKIKLLTLTNKNGDIKWNFCKFLIDRSGNVVDRFSPAYPPEDLCEKIENLL